ncbi:acylneuraminate cytidylyltransferase [Alphaproteobacteria bacterium]|nr:acylneuraminate cytidylyltransferase [Alphaproteobacteria bacterium]
MITNKRKLVAALACRSGGGRLYGKPLQFLSIETEVRIIDHIIRCLKSISCIDQIVLGIAEGVENKIFESIALANEVEFVVGSEEDVLARLIQCGLHGTATDIFRVTTESPFVHFEKVGFAWRRHLKNGNSATFLDEVIDGCGFEILKLEALEESHLRGERRHRSELCSLFIRENPQDFLIDRVEIEDRFKRPDLRLTVDYPEDLVVCRAVYNELHDNAPNISVDDIITFLDSRSDLKSLLSAFVDKGYSTMYL